MNAELIVSSTFYGDVATYICNIGYESVLPLSVECKADGTWTSEPNCASTSAIYLTNKNNKCSISVNHKYNYLQITLCTNNLELICYSPLFGLHLSAACTSVVHFRFSCIGIPVLETLQYDTGILE